MQRAKLQRYRVLVARLQRHRSERLAIEIGYFRNRAEFAADFDSRRGEPKYRTWFQLCGVDRDRVRAMVAATRRAAMPCSRAEWPASGTTWSWLLGHTR